ncbi:hypothetical protein V8E53_006207 [Lactarius tabidus]
MATVNPTIFSPHSFLSLVDTFILSYLRLFCISQLKGRKSADRALLNALINAESYADLDALVKDWAGIDEFAAIKASTDARVAAPPILLPVMDDETASTALGWHGNPNPTAVHDAPPLPTNERRIHVSAGISKWDLGTPTPLALAPRTEPASVSNV